jgi:hypothetical protein
MDGEDPVSLGRNNSRKSVCGSAGRLTMLTRRFWLNPSLTIMANACRIGDRIAELANRPELDTPP